MKPKDSRPITELLREWKKGDPTAWEELASYIYDDLFSIARNRLRPERKNHTLGAGDLVAELFRKLMVGQKIAFEDRTNFYNLCSHIMRNILVDWARKRKKRIGDTNNLAPEEEALALPASGSEKVLQVNEALTLLSQRHPRAAEVLEMRVYLGLKNQEIAKIIGKSTTIVAGDLEKAKGFMTDYFKKGQA